MSDINKQHEKMMADLHRLLSTQEFKSKEEVDAFMQQLIGKPLPSFPEESLNDEEKAQDLIFEAHDADPITARDLIIRALDLDPECIEAYELLGLMEGEPAIALAFFEKGVLIGREKFNEAEDPELTGKFWLIHETRPFMRCMRNSAECYFLTGRMWESVAILEEMIRLNPNDNQGVRDHLLLQLLVLHELDKFRKYEMMYKEDYSAFALFTRALFQFITDGAGLKANNKLKTAIQQNKHVVPLLLRKTMVNDHPDEYIAGEKSEAKYYAYHAKPLWEVMPGALDWLKGMK
jgi:tetratricopeptide (TPR) repeat protein